MKTPKRDYKTPTHLLAQDIEPDFFEPEYHAQEARWKRKNRVARLKATIARLRAENAHLSKELKSERNLRFSAFNAILEAHKEIAEYRKEQE